MSGHALQQARVARRAVTRVTPWITRRPGRRGLVAVLVALLAMAVWVHPAVAQAEEATGELVVEVRSADEQVPIPGATVRIHSEGQSPREGRSGADGRCRFPGLRPASYTVDVSHATFKSACLKVSVTGGPATVCPSSLLREEKESTLVVRADRILMRADDPTDETRRSATFMETELAGPGSSLQTTLSTMPGIASGALGRVHFRGDEKGPGFSVDGVPMPMQLESRTSDWIDPRFLESVSVQAGGLDASRANATIALTPQLGTGKPYVEVLPTVGTLGTTDLVVRAGGSDPKGTFRYFLGARHGETDVRVEPPNPRSQAINNHGSDTNLVARMQLKAPKDVLGLTLAWQDSQLGVPQNPLNGAAGVRQKTREDNLLGVVSWQRALQENADFRLGLVYLQSHQSMGNNGLFTPFVRFPSDVNDDLDEANLPLNPEAFGSPYLPTTRLSTSQLQPSLEFHFRPTETHDFKVGVLADMITSRQFVNVLDAGGGDGLPNPQNLPEPPTEFNATLNRQAFLGSAWFAHTFSLVKDLVTVNYGLRGDTYYDGATVHSSQVSPRLNVALALTDTQSVHLSYNRLFQAPPLEIDASGQAVARPQQTNAYEVSYEFQPARKVVGKLSFVYNDFHDRLEMELLIPNSNIPLYAPVTFGRAVYKGVEFNLATQRPVGLNAFVTATVGVAKPLTPEADGDLPAYFDDDQRVQLSGGASYRWKSGWLVATDFVYGSGYPQQAIALYNQAGVAPFGMVGSRFSNFVTNLRIGWLPGGGEGRSGSGVSLVIQNLFDARPILHLQSDFSGTSFVPGRRVLLKGVLRW